MENPSLAVSAEPALRRLALRALALASGAYLLACASVYLSQDGLIYHPMRATAANTAGTVALPGADARVLVSVRRSDDGGSVRVAVRDSGPGIKPRDREKIFVKFGQADNRRGGGSGLGLTFCKLVVEAHGGTIGFESRLGEGSLDAEHDQDAGERRTPVALRQIR